jgi:hypothetical protein
MYHHQGDSLSDPAVRSWLALLIVHRSVEPTPALDTQLRSGEILRNVPPIRKDKPATAHEVASAILPTGAKAARTRVLDHAQLPGESRSV